MANNMTEVPANNCQNSAGDFKDPLGATGEDLEDVGGNFAYEVSPAKSVDIDEALAQASSQLSDFTFDDDLENETRDLFVVVDNPEKHATSLESYITFRIKVKTTRPVYDSHEYQVRRRYNDFLWLRQRLEETQPSHLVPPLPEKHSLKRLAHFNQDFVKTRMLALQLFLNRIADHPVLSFNKNFQMFLTAKQWEFQAAKKDGSGFMSRMADSFHNMSAAYMMKNRPSEFTAMNDYIVTFGEKLAVLDRISQRIIKEQYELLNDLNEWGPVFTLWSNSEEHLSQALSGMAKAIEKCFISLQCLVEATETQCTQPLREYALYSDAVKAVLRRRDAIQMEYDMTLEELNRKKEERDQVLLSDHSMSFGVLFGKPLDRVRDDKLQNVDERIDELVKQVEVLNDRAVCADTDLRADMERWHKTKRKDFRQLFSCMADRQIQYYQKCLVAWEESIPLIQHSDLQTEASPSSVSPNSGSEES